ncbi:hypothetical protein DQ384_00535 [Sphaerisporangium album]|uniref:Pycsar effector protein domain-containing protein n=1 Tax=Sphaerisporangium album TaxID=509200 RepID=A0A367FTG0_9ACTN|nr:Pycsar system effector family protein [Sphaerisporangium album]RCG32977.1 hypothetical protein DQ384_00535 [Sphaerisporangium album]
MTTLPDLAAAAVVATLDVEAAAVRAELARCDGKAGTLLAFAGTAFSLLAALAVGTTAAAHLPLPVQAGLWATVVLLAASVAVLLGVILPALPRPRQGTGFTAHAGCDVGQFLAVLADDADAPRRRASDVIRLSTIAMAKYRRLRTAACLMYAALAVLIATLPIGALI